MIDPQQNARLNALLVRLYRSLLQYVIECWPWAGADESAEQQAVLEMVAEQQAHVGKLAELLAERGWPIDFGNYPTEYTDLHYVALDYLLGELVADETELIADIARTLAESAADRAAVALLTGLLESERRHLVRLRTLAAAHPAATA